MLSKYLPSDSIYYAREKLRTCHYLLDYALHKKFHTDALKTVMQRPVRLGIETTNICNANCIFCAYRYQTRKKEIMDIDVYKKTIRDYVAIGGGPIELTPIVGDPLIDSSLIERLHFTSRFTEINEILFYSNAILFDNFDMNTILKSGITEICISTTGFDEAMFTRVYRSKLYSRTFNNILNLLKLNEKLNYPVKVKIYIRGDLSQDALMKFPDFKQIESYRCEIIFTYFYDDWGGIIKQTDLSNEMKIIPHIDKSGPCKLLAFYPKVLVDGTVTACGCRDYNGDSELVLGNIKENSLFEIWTNGKVDQIYNRFYTKNYPQICRNCNQYRSINHFLASKSGKKIIIDTQKRIRQAKLFSD